MAFSVVVTITGNKTVGASFLSANSGDGHKICNAVVDHVMGMAGGCRQGSLDIQVNGGTTGVAASGTLTLSSVVTTNTCVVAGVTLTAETSPSGAAQYAVGLTDAATAANLAACINANSSLAGVVTATSSSAVVTVTAAALGAIGNQIPLVGSTNIVASAAKLTGGVNITPNTFTFGGNL